MSAEIATTAIGLNLHQDFYAYGQPPSEAHYKSIPDDFRVDEVLGFTPESDDKGQHHWLLIEKTGLNTEFVARALAHFADVPLKQVSFSGMKDRQAVTSQWFSVELPATQIVHWQNFTEAGVRLIEHIKTGRKLRRGTHKWNDFIITLRQVSHPEAVLARLNQVKNGVPNYFGEQRFGYQGGNLKKAEQLFAGRRIKDRHLRGLALSAARSYVFNQYLSQRLAQHGKELFIGDVMQLVGSQSFFIAESIDAALLTRVQQRDIEVTGPLVGRGVSNAQAAALTFEQNCLQGLSKWCEGLEKAGLERHQRALWLYPEHWQARLKEDVLQLSFRLPKGSFATAVLRELVQLK